MADEHYLLTVLETINLFLKLVFVAHPDKSKFILAKIVERPGFINDSEKIATYLSDQKNQKIYEKLCVIPTKPKLTKRLLVLPQTLNQVHIMRKKIGMLVVHLPGLLQKENHCQDALDILSAS